MPTVKRAEASRVQPVRQSFPDDENDDLVSEDPFVEDEPEAEPEEEEEHEPPEEYTAEWDCSNCGTKNRDEIPYGQRIDETELECKKCGCY